MKNILILFTFFCFTGLHAEDISKFQDTRTGIKRLKTLPPTSQYKTVKNENENEKTPIIVVTNAPLRIWTSNKGTTISAKLTGLSTDLAIFKKSDGKKIKINRNELALVDQKQIEHYETYGEFPTIYTKKNIIIAFSAASTFLLFAAWFVKGRKKPKYKTPKRNITIGTGL